MSPIAIYPGQVSWSLEEMNSLVQAILILRRDEVFSFQDFVDKGPEYMDAVYKKIGTEQRNALKIVLKQKWIKHEILVHALSKLTAGEPSWVILSGDKPLAVYQNVEGIGESPQIA